MIAFESFQRIHEAITIIESGVVDDLSVGHHDLTEQIYVNVMEYETKDDGLFESHHRYIDIHYIIEGSERIEIADENNLDVTEPYNEKDDYVLGRAKGKQYMVLEKHPFVVMPGEAHLPGLKVEEIGKVKKAVIKVMA